MERGRCQLLQQRWNEVLRRHADEVAVRLPGGRSVTFRELDGMAGAGAGAGAGAVAAGVHGGRGSGGADGRLEEEGLLLEGGTEGGVRAGGGGGIAVSADGRRRVVVAAGNQGLGFVVEVLRAWRADAVFCPVEGSGVFAGPDARAALQKEAETVAGELDLPDNICHVKQTSGSTGVPRRVLFRAEQLAADADQIVATMGLRREWPNVGVISMAHSYGFSNLVLPLLLHGIPLILAESALPESVREALSVGGAFTLPAVPAMWRAWHGAGVVDGKIRLAISAGAPLPLALEQSVFAETGVKLHNFYGSSECGGIAYDRTDEPRGDGLWAGTAMEGVALSVDAESGCLTVRGAAVAEGYAGDAAGEDGGAGGSGAGGAEGTKRTVGTKRTKGTEGTADPTRDAGCLAEAESSPSPQAVAEPQRTTLADGVFLTTDEVALENGGVRLEGRATDAINVAGRKISPSRIEEAVCQVPGVGHCVAFGVPSADAARVEEIAVCLSLVGEAGIADVRRAAASLLAAWEMPRHWRVCPGVRPDARGKISRAAWRAKWRRGELES